MTRWITFLFGISGYAIGLGSLVLFMLFVGGWEELPVFGQLPWQINAPALGSFGHALLINVGLILLFGLQHSVMARPGFKRVWTKVIPKTMERSCYCVATGIVTCLMVMFWQPLAGTVWHVEHAGLATVLTALQIVGWMTAVAASFMINHFELFGVQQTYYHLIHRSMPEDSFTVKYLYRFVRHPLQLGILIGIWATPHMSTSHMFLSAAMSIYITIGLYFEERDLAASLGEAYLRYRQQVPMIFPTARGLPADGVSDTPKAAREPLATTPAP